jgi:hypothetical protein
MCTVRSAGPQGASDLTARALPVAEALAQTRQDALHDLHRLYLPRRFEISSRPE